MKLTQTNILIICGIVLSIYLILMYKNTSSVVIEEGFDLRPKSLQNFNRTNTGHMCENGIDDVYDSNSPPKFLSEQGGWYGDKLMGSSEYKNLDIAKDKCVSNTGCAGIQKKNNNNKWSLMPYGLNSPETMKETHQRFIKNKKKRNNLSPFCKKYAGRKTMSDIATILIPNAIKITSNNLKTLSSKELPIYKIWTGKLEKRHGLRMPLTNSNRDNNLLRNQHLTELEAINLCSKTSGCEHISVGNITSSSNGICHMEPPQNYRNAVINKDYTLFSKKFNYEYSISFWFKIDNTSNTPRNILHLGKNKDSHAPSIWISPEGTKLVFWQSTTESLNGEYIGPTQETGYRKWNHLVYTLKENQVKIFLNGKEIIHHYFKGSPIMPIDEPLTLVKSGADGNYHLSKMMWFPVALTPDLVRNFAFSTYPLNEFDPEHSLIRSDIVTVKFRNNWIENKDNSKWSEVILKKVGNLIFLDGSIKGPNINSSVAKIPNSYAPDRDCYFIGATIGGYVSILIKKTGHIYIYDSSHLNGKYSKIVYTKNSPVSLSNIRYLKNSPRNKLSTGGISYDRIGSYIVLSGVSKYSTYQNGELMERTNLENSVKVKNNFLVTGFSNSKKPANIRIMKDGIRVDNSHNNGALISMEGIFWNTFNGEKLNLKNSYFSKGTPWAKDITVSITNNIVQLNGTIIKHYRKPNFKNIKKPIGCYKNDYNNYLGNNYDATKCGEKAIKKGHLYIGLSNKGECRSGTSYGSLGNSDDCYMKCDANPEEMCGGPLENTVYDVSQQKELITILPIKYRPRRNLSFACSSGEGITNINIMVDGHVYWISTSLTNNKTISLNNIVYLAEPQINLVGDMNKGSGNSYCQFDYIQGSKKFKYCSKFSNNMTSCDHFNASKNASNIKECHLGLGACCLERDLISA